MKKEDLIAKGLTEEQAKVVLELYDTEIKDYVPKVDFDNDNSEINTLKSTIKDRDKQIEEIKEKAGDNEELKNQITTLQNDNKAAAEKYKSEIEALKISNAVDMALTNAGAKTLKACKALLDMDSIKLDKDGKVTGLNEQIKAISEADDTKYLFDSGTPALRGTQLGHGTDDTEVDTSKMNYTELCAYLEANPDAKI